MALRDSKRPKRLIVNADDFGKSASANQAILQAHGEGILTTASLMVNEPGFAEAVALARQQPRLGVGLHLTLVDGHASLPPGRIPGLVDAQGRFPADPARAGWRYFFHRRLHAPLHAEIEAQFEKFRATGLPLDHVDSHHHLHMHPTIMGYLLGQAGRLGITHLRLTREPFRVQWRAGARFSLARSSHALAHGLLAWRARPGLRRLSIRHPDAVFGLLNDGGVDEAYLARLLPVLPAGNSEVYSHPSLDQFKHELEALISPRIRALVKTLGLELIRYQDL
jgi:hopanoid biosynthesis associated protein HpnK